MLTTGVDDISPTAAITANKTTDGNDTINGTATTLTALDKIDGGKGIDKLVIKDDAGLMNKALPSGMSITSVEKMTVQTSGSLGEVANTGTPAVAQVNTYTFANPASVAAATMVVNYGSVTSTITTGATADATGAAASATAFAAAINAAAGQTIAVATAANVVVTAPTAGTALPAVTFGAVSGTAVVPAIVFTTPNTVAIAATASNIVYDVSSITDLTDMTVTTAQNVNLKAAATTNVDVSGATGSIKVLDAKDVTITNATAAQTITVGDNSATTGNPAGKVTITDTDNSGANAITVTGGTDVTVTTTAKANATGAITVGHATNGTASGAVSVTQNLNSDAAATLSGAAIDVIGGKTVNVTQNATSTATLIGSNNAITTGAVTVTADTATTDVTVKAIANITEFIKPAVALVKATQDITFKALAAGKSVTVDSLVFTAAKDLTAAEVAQAFANLAATADTQSTGGVVGNGIYTIAKGTTASSGAANGATVTFTSTTATLTALTVSSSDVANSTPTLGAVVAGTASAIESKSGNGVTNSTVAVNDTATLATIQNITVDGATTVTLGTAGSLDALKTLSLTNVSGATGITSAVTTLDMTLNKVTGVITLNALLTDLNLTTTGAASTSAMVSGTLKNLTIDAAAAVNVGGGTMMSTAAGLQNITVKGAAAVTLGTVASTALKSFDAAANTGGVTATINAHTAGSTADLTKFVFSAGNDVVTTGNATVNKEIDLGAGDDKITLVTSSTAITAAIKGGTGTNTIAMEAATAATLLVGAPAAANMTEKVTGFARLELTTATAADTTLTIDLAAIGGYNYVTTKGTGTAGNGVSSVITLNNMANNGTVVLTDVNGTPTGTGTSGIVVNVKDAATVDSTLNAVISSTGNLIAGILTAANVKTVNINIVDTETGATPTKNVDSLLLTADKATTVKVTGTADFTLGLTGSTKVTLVDASELNGGLTVSTTVSTAATTVKGGTGNDNLTATSNNDVLIGGAGNDKLTVATGNLVQLHGGEGKDTYVIGVTANQSAFATINGTAAELSGDVIQFGTQPIVFSTAKLVLDAGVASFDSYVNLAANSSAVNTVSYFEWAGNTYLVHDKDGATTGTFVAGADSIVKIAGVVDFTYNATALTVLEIA